MTQNKACISEINELIAEYKRQRIHDRKEINDLDEKTFLGCMAGGQTVGLL